MTKPTSKKTKANQPQSQADKSSAGKAKLTWLPKKTFELEFSVAWKEVKAAYEKVLDQLTQTAKLEGFRQGKAPKDLVEKSIDKAKLYGEVINQLLPLSYAQAVKQHNLRPATAPKVQILKAEENQAWQFKATSCELPKVELGDYKKIVSGALAKEKIWTPGKGDPEKAKDKDISQTQKLNLISKALIDEIKLDLPDLLIDTERDRLLAKLLDQVQKLGLTIEQYAASANKTIDSLKAEHQKIAENSLKMELILQAIADDQNIKIKDEDINKMIESAGDDKIKKQLQSPAEKAYITSVLRKRRVIDYLLTL